MEIIDALGGFAELTATGLLGLVVILIIRGDLIPSKTNAFLISERDVLKEANLKQQETIAKMSEALEALTEVGRNMDHFLRSLPAPIDTHVAPEESE